MRGLGGQFAAALQAVDDGGRFALQAVQNFAMCVCRGIGHRDALSRQVLHEPQVKRQLFKAQALKNGEHILTLVGAGKVVGVFYAALAAFQVLQLP